MPIFPFLGSGVPRDMMKGIQRPQNKKIIDLLRSRDLHPVCVIVVWRCGMCEPNWIKR